MLADALFPSSCPLLESLCTHLDDDALVKVAQCRSKRAVASALREMARRPVFALLQDIAGKGRWKASTEFYNVCETGSLWGAHNMIQRGANDWDAGLHGACFGGHRDVAELMIQNGANAWNGGLWRACCGGHRGLAELMIQKGANDWDAGLHCACFGGHRDLAELMIKNGANALERWAV